MKKSVWFGCILMLIVGFVSCTRFHILKKEVARIEQSYYLKAPESKTEKNVWIFIWEKYDNGLITITEAEPLNSNGKFLFMLPPGNRYYVGALEDINDNQKYDPGERLWVHGDPSPVDFKDGESQTLIIHLSESINLTEEDALGLSKAREGKSYLELKGREQVPLYIGEPADLNDPKFSEEMGIKGFWEPASFLNEIGIGVFFLSEYDPEKIPILFVHGAKGSPQVWKFMFENLNDRAYQKWFYYYPSGVRLDSAAGVLNTIVDLLHNKYQFKELCVIAHSMGGLVARSFIIKNRINDKHLYVKKFVSISTPWAGSEAAALGVEQAPVAIPSWLDMQVNSPFIEDLLNQKIGDKLSYYLLFTFKGKSSIFLPASNDGTVSMLSQLEPRIQQEAKRVYGFNSSHTLVLQDHDVIKVIERMLK